MTRKEVKRFIESLLNMRNGVTDELAVESIGVYPEWKPDTEYIVNARVRHGGLLYKCRQQHISQNIYPPDTVSALWAVINETNKGTIDDPIPAVVGMQYEKDLYYIYNDVVYLCIREDTEGGTVLHFTPDHLIGNYFEVAS